MAARADARDLAAEFVERALRETDLTVEQLAHLSNVTRVEIWKIRKRSQKNSCRVDTLVALLAACGFELRMEKKRCTTRSIVRT